LIGAAAHADEMRIGFVNPERVMREATFAKTALGKVDQEFAKRKSDLQDMQARLQSMAEKYDRDAPLLTDAERVKRQRELSDMDKDFQRKQREAQEDYNQRRNEEFAAINDRVMKVINQIAASENYDVVVQEALYHSQRVDITDKVLKALNK
jgi:outer membrane protein